MLMNYGKNETTKYIICCEAELQINEILQVKGIFKGCPVCISCNYWDAVSQ